jgi:rhomboid protease GluP
MYATWILGAVCAACYLLVDLWSRSTPDVLVKLHAGANSARLVREGEWWRLLSHAFLHDGFAHITVNMVALYSFGGFLERLLGWRRYLLLYGLSALAGGVASALVGGVTMSVGASGAIWGLMAAGVGLVTARQPLLPALMQNRLRPRFLWLAALNVGLSLLPLIMPAFRIDYRAHLGGGLVGFALVASGWLTRGLPPPAAFNEGERPPPIVDPPVIRVAALLMGLALALALALAFKKGTPWKIQALPAAADGPDPGQETEL